MPFDRQERRVSVLLACVVDHALDLAAHCGWRYAIAYLISEEVPAPIIQRLLSGEGRMRRDAGIRNEPLPSGGSSNADDMRSLFDSVRERRANEACACSKAACASRASAPDIESD